MTRLSFSVTASLFLSSAALFGQATRTWVSGVGDDVNPCSRTAPCKTFAGAISKTAAGGEISVLDPGGFGALTITKSITINGAGTLAGILSSATNGIVINALTTDVIVLKNLSINGAGTGINGIRLLSAKRLEVYDTTIERVTTHGIDVSTTSSTNVVLSNVRTSNTGSNGINLNTTAGLITAQIKDSSFVGGANGIRVQNGCKLTVRNSTVSAMTASGISVETTGLTSEGFLDSTTVTGGANGIQAGPGGVVVRIGNMSVTGATTNGLFLNGGVILSFSNNKVSGNTNDGNASATVSFK